MALLTFVTAFFISAPIHSRAATASLIIHANIAGKTNLTAVRAIIKQSDGSYVSGEWGPDSWPAVTFRGKALSPTNAVAVLTGQTMITIGKGQDYLPQIITTNLATAGKTYTISITLQPQLDLFSRGWSAGDAHVHFLHGGGDTNRTPADVYKMATAAGYNFISLCEEHYGATTLTRQQMFDVWKVYDGSECNLWLGLEEPKNQWGHHASILFEPWSIRSAIPHGQGMHDVHQQGGVCYTVHPERWYPLHSYNGVFTQYPLNNQIKDFPLEALVGHTLDGWSGVSDEPYNTTTLVCYSKLLAMGYKIPLLADSDFCFDGSNNGAHSLGFWMNYFYLDGNPLSQASVCNAIRKGRVMCTTGPLVQFSIDGAISGDTFPADGKPHTVRIEASYQFDPWTLSYSNFDGTARAAISQIDLIRNGQVFKSWTTNTQNVVIQQPITETTNNSYYMVRVVGNESKWMAGYASPIYFENAPRPRQPAVFKPEVRGRLYDAKTGNSLTGMVSCVRYGQTDWTIPTDQAGRFRARVPIDADLVAQDSLGRTFTQNILKYEPAYSFLHYLPDNYSLTKDASVDAFSNLVRQVTWEFAMGLQTAASYVRTNLTGDTIVTNISILSAPAPFSGKSSTEIVMLIIDKTQVQIGDTVNYAAIFRQPQNKTPTEQLGVVWTGWDPVHPRIFTKYQTAIAQNEGTSGHINLGNGFYMRGGSFVVPDWVTNDTSTTGAIQMRAAVRSGSFLETAYLQLRLGPTRRELLVSTTSDGFPATWGQIGVGPCTFFRDLYLVRYADYRNMSVRLTLNGQQITISPTSDTAHVADADNAFFYENFYYDGQCEPTNRNIPFRDPVRTQPPEPDYSSVPLQDPSDTTPPNVALMSPFDGATVSNQPVRFFYFIDDAGLSGADTATLLIDALPIVSGTTNNPILLNLGTGAHTWQVRGLDKAGNSRLSAIRTFTVVNGSGTNTPPVLGSPSFNPPQRFDFRFDSVPGQNYSLQFTTDFSAWTTFALTNASTNVVNASDVNAINAFKFYRVLLGP
ncbi:MAG: CehA/McbA family metallohydrolase [Limisphaerales bacterium]